MDDSVVAAFSDFGGLFRFRFFGCRNFLEVDAVGRSSVNAKDEDGLSCL